MITEQRDHHADLSVSPTGMFSAEDLFPSARLSSPGEDPAPVLLLPSARAGRAPAPLDSFENLDVVVRTDPIHPPGGQRRPDLFEDPLQLYLKQISLVPLLSGAQEIEVSE